MSKMSTQVKIGLSNFGRHFPKKRDPEFDGPQNLVKYIAKYNFYKFFLLECAKKMPIFAKKRQKKGKIWIFWSFDIYWHLTTFSDIMFKMDERAA